MTFDGTDSLHPNGLHPDQHDIVTHPNNPYQFFETNDGGVMRSSGEFVNRSSWCDDRRTAVCNPVQKARCQQMLSRDPGAARGHERRAVHAAVPEPLGQPAQRADPPGRYAGQRHLGDPGTRRNWENTMIGDGGQSGFDVAIPEFRFHNFTNVIAGRELQQWQHRRLDLDRRPVVGTPGEFYSPVISDPVVSKTMFAGTGPDGVPDEDCRPRHDDDRRGKAALQRMDRRLRGPVR